MPTVGRSGYCPRTLLSMQKLTVIYRSAVDPDLIMKMRPCCASAHADGADNFTLFNLLSHHHEDPAEVGIAGCNAIAVVDGITTRYAHLSRIFVVGIAGC